MHICLVLTYFRGVGWQCLPTVLEFQYQKVMQLPPGFFCLNSGLLNEAFRYGNVEVPPGSVSVFCDLFCLEIYHRCSMGEWALQPATMWQWVVAWPQVTNLLSSSSQNWMSEVLPCKPTSEAWEKRKVGFQCFKSKQEGQNRAR